ncbi:MAG TPA: cob(I)yrinic acid a,c-diamide adenosyltransferase [Planctomycetes bacterium]|nr:cob(I)yrinic acid a,c-diamide adenosyltransferase [Planctomycetota bacterium]
MKIYTRAGDGGETALFGGGKVSKHHLRVVAYGAVDELNAVLGWCLASCECGLDGVLTRESNRLFVLGGHLATPADASEGTRSHLPGWEAKAPEVLEAEIDSWSEDLSPLENFILPGGCESSARLHVARTVCRRAERELSALAETEEVPSDFLVYLNRLSDWLFVAAREANRRAEVIDVPWTPEN